jgi:hypothetical protein
LKESEVSFSPHFFLKLSQIPEDWIFFYFTMVI